MTMLIKLLTMDGLYLFIISNMLFFKLHLTFIKCHLDTTTERSLLFLCYIKVQTIKPLPHLTLPLNSVCLRDVGATFDTCAGSKCQVSTVTPCREGEGGSRAVSNSSLDVGYGAGSATEDQIADIPRKCETVGCR